MDKHEILQRIYAGVLGKIIGVYAGRPIEGWSHAQIKQKIGYVGGFVHQQLGQPLIVVDDDISGTLSFLRALREHHYRTEISSYEIGQTWLNQLLEQQSILWWGGYGLSSEQTAYYNLKSGIAAPASGAISTNGAVIAEQIGAQIFIDGWAMCSPGNPARAVQFAEQAARVSHDGEAVYAAMIVASMEAQAFIEPNLQTLLKHALSYIPHDSLVSTMIGELRQLHNREPDWEKAFAWFCRRYNYQKYPGNCHVIPNHGLVILSLLYAGDDFAKAMTIANTLGWDTDCNAANVGCLTAIRLGLAAIPAHYRDAVADRLYLASAECGAVTDALQESLEIARLADQLDRSCLVPDKLPRYSFYLPGSRQGFRVKCKSGQVFLQNPAGGQLELHYQDVGGDGIIHLETASFFQEDTLACSHYQACGSPSLYSGQQLSWQLSSSEPLVLQPLIHFYQADNRLATLTGPPQTITDQAQGQWRIPDTSGHPIIRFGFALQTGASSSGVLTLDWVDIGGEPEFCLRSEQPQHPYLAKSWLQSVPEQGTKVFQTGRGTILSSSTSAPNLLYTGHNSWSNYSIQSEIYSDLCVSLGLVIRLRGLINYYALLIDKTQIQLVKIRNGKQRVLARHQHVRWNFPLQFSCQLAVQGTKFQAVVDNLDLHADDADDYLCCGAAGYLVRQGTLRASQLCFQATSAN